MWEAGFWISSVPIVLFFYYYTTSEWPDLNIKEDQAKVITSVLAYINIARLAVPRRLALALSTVNFIDNKVVNPLINIFNTTNQSV